jgi:hypothetical protein
MSKFIKFSKLIVNTNYIQSIVIQPNKYSINVVSNKFDGSNWFIPLIGNGIISSYNNEIEVCETKHSSDYKILNDWIVNETKKYVKKKL